MKKTSIVFLLLALVVLSACAAKSPIKDAVNCTDEQAATIESILADNGIAVKSIAPVAVDSRENPFAAALFNIYEPYELVAQDGKEYRITIKAEDKTLFSIVDNETQEFVYGWIGNLFK